MKKTALLLTLSIAVLTSILSTSCSNYRSVLKGTSIPQKYKMAEELYNKGDYHRAMQLLDELLIYYRGTDTSEKINYYYAQCYYGEGEYLEAGFYFSKFCNTFPTSKYAEESQYMAAYCQYLYSPKYSLDQTISEDAIDEFQMFINTYPSSERVAKCNELIDELRGKLEKKAFETAKLYYKIGNYESAVVAFKNLLIDFPDTRFKEEAFYYTLLSKYNFALNSIETKKIDRLNIAKEAFNMLLTTYPQSKYEKNARIVLKNIDKELANLLQPKENSNIKKSK